VLVFKLELPENDENLFRMISDKKIPKFSVKKRTFKIAPFPFDNGSTNCAYYSLATTFQPELNVFKQFMDEKKRILENYKAEVAKQTISSYLAKIFNHKTETLRYKKILGNIEDNEDDTDDDEIPYPRIKYLLLQSVSRKTENGLVEYYLVEKYLTFFKKLSSNLKLYDNKYNKYQIVIEAFSHFTYVHTKGKLIVTDIQGSLSSVNPLGDFALSLILTDPCLHTMDRRMFPHTTNHGDIGFKYFFEQHDCTNNAICIALEYFRIRYCDYLPKYDQSRDETTNNPDEE